MVLLCERAMLPAGDQTIITRGTVVTKKHFVAVAKTFLELRRETDGTFAVEGVERTIRALAAVFADFNGRFDVARFLRACGLEG